MAIVTPPKDSPEGGVPPKNSPEGGVLRVNSPSKVSWPHQ